MEQFLFGLYALLACGAALAVVVSQNVVRMAFYLVISLGSTAGLFFLLNADFVGATQLLIYVGGTVVLLIFGVMLTSSTPFTAVKSSPAEVIQGGVIGLAFLAVVISSVLAVKWDELRQPAAGHVAAADPAGGHAAGHGTAAAALSAPTGFNPPEEGNTARSIGAALLGARFDKDLAPAGAAAHEAAHGAAHAHEHAHDHAHSAAHAEPASLSTGYLLPFEIVSVHLLVVLVGAAYLARAKRQNPAAV
jgi:NADH:ubiquinone oxidoreductase subunit 6 (subunit J)